MSLTCPTGHLLLVVDDMKMMRALAAQAPSVWPGVRCFAVLLGLGDRCMSVSLDYSKATAAVPEAFAEPSWRISGLLRQAYEFHGGFACASKYTCREMLNTSPSIICACSPTHSGAIAFMEISKCFHSRSRVEEPYSLIAPGTTCEELVRRAMANPWNTHGEIFPKQVTAGRIKAYFDFNYNLASAKHFSPLLAAAGLSDSEFVITKHCLQLLYRVASLGLVTKPDLAEMMLEWSGTMAYFPVNLGSADSQPKILGNLLRVGLLQEDGEAYRCTTVGYRFLSSIPDKCCDPDQAGRLQSWMCMQIDTARARIERYLKIHFQPRAEPVEASSEAA
ncbi:hypothetical protein HNP46_000035 [Pseudomonas nitritireducens]|uniref:Uncharacterized protein n=1 Tax=Pseudomonas nitroreducens TaxID=46680 RepID=A0A7W7KE80_PSENT|nr:hypothetical protein [Pseudomonas nitritireducens]MBB4861224.1 hypothetical protein [Pseudomonas nitritireducens]